MKKKKSIRQAKKSVPERPVLLLSSGTASSEEADDSHHYFDFINKSWQANLAKITRGISPASLMAPWFSWGSQLAQAPGTLMKLTSWPLTHSHQYLDHLLSPNPLACEDDIRFHRESWGYMPWRLYAVNFLMLEKWWQNAAAEVPGLSKSDERTVSFGIRQCLDAWSPSNFIATNPDLFQETLRSNGLNVLKGTEIAWNNVLARAAGLPPPGAENFIPGKNVAITSGKIVFRNHLIELIQYKAQSKNVYREPVLILPAWIMKYYILDLSAHNSLVKWLVEQGHTVFMISWRNPDKDDRHLGMDDYYRQGAMAAIDAICQIIPKTKVHLTGYCIGGTLAMIVAAAMAENRDNRLKSLTLLAAQGDFTQAGELMLFISKSEVSFLENMMWDEGYLDPKQMAGAFQMLRSYDLIWSKIIQDYMSGRERGMIDLLAWNADATRMPYKMHSEYLEKLFLNNEFAEGNYKVEGELVAPQNIELPIFAVSTEKDHIAPWQSVYKIHILTDTDITFVLANGGHNAGIVSEPNHDGRYYFIQEEKAHTPYIGPKKWLKTAERQEGSWWIPWQQWLVENSSPTLVPARRMRVSLPPAPGNYVMQK